jgi:gliding motility-associated-like protein
VQAPPVADFVFTPEIITGFDSTVTFTSLSTDATQWFWTFGDGKVAFSENPVNIYSGAAREYCVNLWIANDFGCENQIQKCIPVDPSLTIFFPNSFTPNRDGKNDYYGFHGSVRNISAFRFLVFDRWGELVFETTDFLDEWNGTLKNTGDDLMPGTYVYRADITTIDMKDHVFIGHLNLIR